jgi:4-hydroxy-tetrahydrodipicolinate synthase
VRLAKHAEKVGADAVLIVSPYYNKPTQAGLKAHFTAIANELSSIPLIIYDIPGRSIVRVEDTLLAELAEHKNIVGIKDATGDAGRPARLCNLIEEEFCQLSGDDATAFSYLASGGHGMISVVSNIAPKLYADMFNAFSSGELKTGMALNKKLMPLHDGLFCEASPGPVKYAAERLGLCSSEVRLPLVSISADAKRVVDSALAFAGLV